MNIICETNPSYGTRCYPMGSMMSDGSFEDMADTGSCYPPVEVSTENGRYVMTAEVPGMDREDIQLEVGDGMLTMRGVKKREHEGCQCSERYFGSFERTVEFPAGVSLDKFEARLKNGILTMSVPFSEGAGTRRIEISDD